MITEMDIDKNRLWLSKRKHGSCIYNYIDIADRSGKCLSIFPELKKDRHKPCNYQCPCDQYGTVYVISIVRKLVDTGQVTQKGGDAYVYIGRIGMHPFSQRILRERLLFWLWQFSAPWVDFVTVNLCRFESCPIDNLPLKKR